MAGHWESWDWNVRPLTSRRRSRATWDRKKEREIVHGEPRLVAESEGQLWPVQERERRLCVCIVCRGSVECRGLED